MLVSRCMGLFLNRITNRILEPYCGKPERALLWQLWMSLIAASQREPYYGKSEKCFLPLT